MPTIAEATIDLHANVAKLRQDLARGQAETRKFQQGVEAGFRQLKGILGGIGIAAVTTQLIAFGRRAIEAAGQIRDVADQLRISTDSLQAFNAAANESGVGAESFQAGIAKLNESIGEAVGGNKTAIKSFADLGVSFKDANGEAVSAERAVEDLAARYEDAADKTQFLSDLTDVMGKNAGRYGVILDQVADGGLQKFIDRQRELGLVAGEDTINVLDQLGDAFDRLGTRISVMAQEATAELARFFGFVERSQRNLLDRELASLRRQLDAATVAGGAQAHMQRGKSPQEIQAMRAAGAAEAEELRRQIADIEAQIEELRGETLPPPSSGVIDTGLSGGGGGGGRRSKRSLPDKVVGIPTLIANYEEMVAGFVAANEAATRRLEMALDAEAAAAEDAADATRDMTDATADYAEAGQALTGVLGSLVDGSFDARNALGSLLQFIVNDLMKLQDLGGGGGSILGSLFSSIFSGIGAGSGGGPVAGQIGTIPGIMGDGGPVSAGAPYIVGDRGPELFVPGMSGRIVPNGEFGGSTFFIDARGADREGFRRLERMIAAVNGSIEERSVSAVRNARVRGGRFADAFR